MTLPHINHRRPRPRPHRNFLNIAGHPALVLLATLVVTSSVYAERSSVDSATPVSVIDREDLELGGFESVDDILKTMVTEGKVSLNIRGRAEIADQEGKETSQAYTVRTRLGFTTGEYNGLYVHIDVEDIRAADDSLYNAAGTNGQPDKTVIADPEDTELNQLYVNYEIPGLNGHVRIGRQRIKFNDDRFIGNVGWRQNEQTYDAAMFSTMPNEQVEFDYTYIWDVNRIFGPDADKDFGSDSHLVRLSYDDATFGKLTGFAYLLDLDGEATAAANSSDTYGLRYEATRNLKGDPEGPKLGYVLSWATQSDSGDNPTDYTADYYLIDVKFIESAWYVGGGWELLGSDNGAASFQTPLATLHGKNGWADVFLTTPADGLEDTYIYLGGDLPAGFKGRVVYHWFDPDEGGRDFGEELDAVVKKKLSDNADLLVKYAYYNGDAAFADRAKFWLQLTLNY
jgi:Alginate export